MAIGTTAAVIGASAVGGLAQAGAARQASRAQRRAARDDLALQERIYEENVERFAPYEAAGQNALNAYLFEMGLGPRPTFGETEYGGYSMTPGNRAVMQEGLNALEGSAAARGGLYSGATMQALQRAGQEYTNRFQGQYMDRLGGLAASGQNAAGQGAAAATNYGAAASDAYANIGNAASAGAIAQGNALSGAINNGIGIWQYQNMLNSFGGGS